MRQYVASPNNRVVAVQLINNQVLVCSESKILLVYPQRTIIEVPDIKSLKKLRHGQNGFDLALREDHQPVVLACSDYGDLYWQTDT